MEEATKLPVKISNEFNLDIDQIYVWGIKTFGTMQAELYENEITFPVITIQIDTQKVQLTTTHKLIT